jgi:hypothetical protein
MDFYYAIQANQLLSVQSPPQVRLPMQRPSMRMPSPNSKYLNAVMHHKFLKYMAFLTPENSYFRLYTQDRP